MDARLSAEHGRVGVTSASVGAKARRISGEQRRRRALWGRRSSRVGILNGDVLFPAAGDMGAAHRGGAASAASRSRRCTPRLLTRGAFLISLPV